MKLKRIFQKSSQHKKRLSKKNISKKISFRKKWLIQQIDSPHNTNEFLINNQSSPFYPEDEEDSITIHQSDIIPFEDDTNYEIDLFSIKGLESTNEESVILNEKSDQVKEENEKCLDNTKK